jgi:hypothetical protein
MKLGAPILKILAKVYPVSQMVELRFGRYDIAFQTDHTGRPVLLFVGQKQADGLIKGERFTRRLVTAPDGRIIKDHWDAQGKTDQRR